MSAAKDQGRGLSRGLCVLVSKAEGISKFTVSSLASVPQVFLNTLPGEGPENATKF